LAKLGRHEEIAADIDIHGLLEGAEIGIQDVAEVGIGGGVIDQDVEPAVRLLDVLDQRVDLSISPTWQTKAEALPPAVWISSATRPQPSALRLEQMTWAPWAASSLAVASPMPRLAPDTSAILPLRSNRLDCIA